MAKQSFPCVKGCFQLWLFLLFCFPQVLFAGVNTERLDVIHEKLRNAFAEDSMNQVIFYAKKLQMHAMEQGETRWLAEAYYLEGNAFFNLKQYHKSIEAYTKALPNNSKLEDEGVLLNVLYNMALAHKRISNLEAASRYLFRFLEVPALSQFPSRAASGYETLGNIKRAMGELDKAFEYHYRSMAIRKKGKDSLGLAKCHNNIGNVHFDNETFDSAKFHLKKSIQLKEALHQEGRTGYSLQILGRVHAAEGAYGEAAYYYRRALVLHEKEKVAQQYVYCLGHWAEALLHQGKLDSALQVSDTALVRAEMLDGKDELATVYQGHGEILFALGEYETAFTYQKKYQALREQILNRDKQRAISELEIKHEVAETHQKLQQEKELRSLSATKLSNQRLVSLSLAMGLLLFGMAILWLRSHVKSEKRMGLQKERLLRELHHRVENNLTTLTGALAIQEMTEENEDVKRVIRDHRNRTDAVNILHNKLFSSNANDSRTEVRFDDFLQELTNNLVLTHPLRDEIKLQMHVDDLVLDMDRAVPLGMIVNELLTNALKYAFTDVTEPELTVTLSAADAIEVRVEDNGPGLEEPEKASERPSTGMTIVHGLAQQIKGRIVFENRDGLCAQVSVNK